MRLVVNANVVISALIADSTTRELIVTVEPTLLAPAVVHDELDAHATLIAEKSGLPRERIDQFVDLLFEYIETVPVAAIADCIDRAEAAIGDVDPDDVLYVACALARDAAIWSDDSDFTAQDLVSVYTTAAVVEAFGTV